MERNDKLKGMLGLARKAGRLAAGTQLACDAVRAGTCNLMLLASDTSENSRKRVLNCCKFYHQKITVTEIGRADLAHCIGRSGYVSAVAILDPGFAAAIGRMVKMEDIRETAEAGMTGENGNGGEPAGGAGL